MSTRSILFSIHPIIRNTLLILPLLLLILFYFLREGIAVDRLKIGHFELHGLYLKLDKKLIVTLDKLEIPKSKQGAQIGNLESAIINVKRVLRYFEYIQLDSVVFTNNTFRVIYADNIIYLQSDEYEVAGMISPHKNGLRANLPLVYLRKYDLTFNGDLSYLYDTKEIAFKGHYHVAAGVDGNMSAKLHKGNLSFLLEKGEAETIAPLLKLFDLDKNTLEWAGERITAKHYLLEYLQGEGSLKGGQFALDKNTLRARLHLRDVTIAYHDKVAPVTAKKVTAVLKGESLYFDLVDPNSMNMSLAGSKVALYHLMDLEKITLLLSLKAHTPFDERIHKILHVYDITVPVTQPKGKSKVDIKIDIKLHTGKAKTQGRVQLSRGVIKVGTARLPVHSGEVTFTSRQVALWGVDIDDGWYRGKVDGVIHLGKKRADLKVSLVHLTLGDKKGISLVLPKKKLPLKIDFKKQLKFAIPPLKLTMMQDKKGVTTITSSDITKLLPYTKNLPVKLKGGKLFVTTKGFAAFAFRGTAQWNDSYIYDAKGYVTTVPVSGKIDAKGRVQLQALGKKFSYDSAKALIRLDAINIDAKKMLKLYSKKSKKSQKATGPKPLNVKGEKSIIRYEKYVLLTDHFDLKVSGKNTTFMGIKDGDRVHFELNDNAIVVHADKIKDVMLRSLIHFGGMHGGRYTLDLSGDITKEMRGVIVVEGGVISSFKAYNDLIALFNTVPALMTLSNPGFSEKGYEIKDGQIEFRIINNRVHFDKIYLNGKSSTIVGKGTVDLESKAIKIDLAVRTAREIGKVLGSLPVVGYILFGKNKSITTGVKIAGTLEKPIVNTETVKDALLFPLQMIKRTVESPAHIINK